MLQLPVYNVEVFNNHLLSNEKYSIFIEEKFSFCSQFSSVVAGLKLDISQLKVWRY